MHRGPIYRGLQQVVQDFGTQLKRHFAKDIAGDPAGFKKQVLRLIRQVLPPRRGRPNDPQIDAAVRMVEQQGMTVKDVLRSQIPYYDKMDTYGRYLAEKGLRQAIARRRRISSNRTGTTGRKHIETNRRSPPS